jgi:hypothetical protein
LLRSGHYDEGLRTFREVLGSVGFALPASRRAAVMVIILRKLMQQFRGLRFTERDVSTIAPDLLLKVDVLWAAIVGLSRTDNLLAVYFQTTHLRLARQLGDPYRFTRALATEAAFTAMKGGAARKKSSALMARATHYARRVNVPHGIALSFLSAAISSFLQGRFRDALAEAQQADELFRTRCTGVWWELNTAQNYVLTALAYLGQIEMLSQRVSAQLREAEERGDLYAVTDMVGRVGIVWLAVDDAGGALRALRSAMANWSLQGFHLQHLYTLSTEVLIDVYNGEPEQAWRRVQERWPALNESKLSRIQMVRIESSYLHGRVALAAAATSHDEVLIAHAERDARRIRKEKMSWSTPLALSLEAGVAALRGDRTRARSLLAEALAKFEKSELMLHAAAARRRLGELTPGAEGEALVQAADDWMRAQRVKRPEKIAMVLAPM